jgi:cysteinyl-tRNA synthetase
MGSAPVLGASEAAEVEALVAERGRLRRERRFAEADAVRDRLLARGIVLEDGPKGTTWRLLR